MITLETGVPGAGKTLYCVDKLLRGLVGATVKSEDENGNSIEIPRVIYSNINGLLFDHEKIGPEELNTWHLWAKPGAVIVFDEIQKVWEKSPAGSKAPDCIKALETHRHMGVDFIVLTQHPMLIHTNLVQLVGRHLHVRRMGNMPLAIVYEWDSCSKTLLYKNALTKSPWRYSKDAQKLYKSAELHTKQPRKIPFLVYGVLAGLIAMGIFSPSAFSRITDRISGKTSITTAPSKPATAQPPVPVNAQLPPSLPASAPAPLIPASGAPGSESAVSAIPAKFGGCASMRGVCRCYMDDSSPVEKPADFCETTTGAHLPEKAIPIPETLVEYVPKIDAEKISKQPQFTLKKQPQINVVSLADVVHQYRE